MCRLGIRVLEAHTALHSAEDAKGTRAITPACSFSCFNGSTICLCSLFWIHSRKDGVVGTVPLSPSPSVIEFKQTFSPKMVAIFEHLNHLSDVVANRHGVRIASLPGAGQFRLHIGRRKLQHFHRDFAELMTQRRKPGMSVSETACGPR